jgi:hypothetical protein
VRRREESKGTSVREGGKTETEQDDGVAQRKKMTSHVLT